MLSIMLCKYKAVTFCGRENGTAVQMVTSCSSIFHVWYIPNIRLRFTIFEVKHID